MTTPKQPSILPSDPPPPYEPIDLAVVDRAMARVNRQTRRWTIRVGAVALVVQLALYLLGAPGLVLVVWPQAALFVAQVVVLRRGTTKTRAEARRALDDASAGPHDLPRVGCKACGSRDARVADDRSMQPHARPGALAATCTGPRGCPCDDGDGEGCPQHGIGSAP